MLSFIDTHAHLSLLSRGGIDAETRLAELFGSGFGAVLDVGTDSGDLGERIRRFSRFPAVYFSAGIWPSADAIRDRDAELARLRKSIAAAGDGVLVAVGECGFDRHWNRPEDGADVEGERELFAEQAKLAVALNLPIIVHSREASKETVRAIAGADGLRGVIHCFSYDSEEARLFLDLGFYISFAGTVTYKNADALREAARYIPADRLLLETDSPYLAPRPFRGKSAEPGMVEKTYEAVAAVRGVGVETLAATASDNARRLFGFSTKS